MKRHRHQQFIRFLNVIETQVPKRKTIHAHPKGCAWRARHPHWTFHFTPISASWLNAVESFFAKLTRRRLKRGVFRSVDDLKDAINRFIADKRQSKTLRLDRRPAPRPGRYQRGKQALKSVH